MDKIELIRIASEGKREIESIVNRLDTIWNRFDLMQDKLEEKETKK